MQNPIGFITLVPPPPPPFFLPIEESMSTGSILPPPPPPPFSPLQSNTLPSISNYSINFSEQSFQSSVGNGEGEGMTIPTVGSYRRNHHPRKFQSIAPPAPQLRLNHLIKLQPEEISFTRRFKVNGISHNSNLVTNKDSCENGLINKHLSETENLTVKLESKNRTAVEPFDQLKVSNSNELVEERNESQSPSSDVAANSDEIGRPQSSEGRTFPTKKHPDAMVDESLVLSRKRRFFDPEMFVEESGSLVLRTATKLIRAPLNSSLPSTSALKLAPMSSVKPLVESSIGLKRNESNGTLSRNGMSWKRVTTGLPNHNEPPEKKSRSLRRINDKLYNENSRECFNYLQNGSCKAGIFCNYDHNASTAHSKKVCARFLSGRCRGKNCKLSHDLKDHQIPICDYYLRMICNDEQCKFLHVKYTEGIKSCLIFNRGVCMNGDSCSFPHRYLLSIIKRKGISSSEVEDNEKDSEEAEEDDNKEGLLEWYE